MVVLKKLTSPDFALNVPWISYWSMILTWSIWPSSR